MQYGRVSGSRSSLHEVTIYKSEQNLDTEKLYPKVNSPFKYSFSFVIPQDAIQLLCNHYGDKNIGSIPMLVNSHGTIRWYIDVKLVHEAMLTFPIGHKQEVHIVAPAQ